MLALGGLIVEHHQHHFVSVPSLDSIHSIKYFGRFHVDVSVILNYTSALMTKLTHSLHFDCDVQLNPLYLPRLKYIASLNSERLDLVERHLKRRGASASHCSNTEIASHLKMLLLLAVQ